MIMFLALRGKPTGGPTGIPQSYVTTASNILSSLFAMTLNAAMAVAFTQHLWLIFREKPLKVTTIETLYKSRSDLLSFIALDSYRQAPFLILIAAFGWTTNVAVSFVPGALTVQTAFPNSVENITVPTFDPYYVGNGERYQLPALMSEPTFESFTSSFALSIDSYNGSIASSRYEIDNLS